MAGDAYRGRWAMRDCNLGGRVVSSGLLVWITPRWVVASTTCMAGPCGRRVEAVADPLIIATYFVGWTMGLLRERLEMVTSSKSLACWVLVGLSSGSWGCCGLCAIVRLVSSAKPTRGEKRE